MIHSPVVLDKSSLKETKRIKPSMMSVDIKLDQISTVDMTIRPDEQQIELGDFVRIYTQQGDMGVFVCDGFTPDYLNGNGNQYRLSHAISELKKSIVFKKPGKEDVQTTMSVKEFVKKILKRQDLWELGRCEFDESFPYTEDNDDLYELLEYACSPLEDYMWTYDTSKLPFKFNIVKRPTEATCEMRLNRNLSNITVQIDTSDMYNRLYPVGYENMLLDETPSKAYVENKSSIDTYGLIERTENCSDINDRAQLKSWAKAQLKRHCKPIVSVVATGLELSDVTGEPLDKLTVGTVCAIPLQKYGTKYNEIISGIQWADIISAEDQVSVTISSERKTVATILKDIKKASRGGQKKDQWIEDKVIRAGYEFNEEVGYLKTWAGDIDDAVHELQGSYAFQNPNVIELAVGWVQEIDSDGVIKRMEGSLNELTRDYNATLNGVIKKTSEWIEVEGSALVESARETGLLNGKLKFDSKGNLVVESAGGVRIRRTNTDGKIVETGVFEDNQLTAGAIVEALKNGKSRYKITADCIELDGDVIANGLLTGKVVKADGFYCNNGTVTALYMLCGYYKTPSGRTIIDPDGNITAPRITGTTDIIIGASNPVSLRNSIIGIDNGIRDGDTVSFTFHQAGGGTGSFSFTDSASGTTLGADWQLATRLNVYLVESPSISKIFNFSRTIGSWGMTTTAPFRYVRNVTFNSGTHEIFSVDIDGDDPYQAGIGIGSASVSYSETRWGNGTGTIILTNNQTGSIRLTAGNPQWSSTDVAIPVLCDGRKTGLVCSVDTGDAYSEGYTDGQESIDVLAQWSSAFADDGNTLECNVSPNPAEKQKINFSFAKHSQEVSGKMVKVNVACGGTKRFSVQADATAVYNSVIRSGITWSYPSSSDKTKTLQKTKLSNDRVLECNIGLSQDAWSSGKARVRMRSLSNNATRAYIDVAIPDIAVTATKTGTTASSSTTNELKITCGGKQRSPNYGIMLTKSETASEIKVYCKNTNTGAVLCAYTIKKGE